MSFGSAEILQLGFGNKMAQKTLGVVDLFLRAASQLTAEHKTRYLGPAIFVEQNVDVAYPWKNFCGRPCRRLH